MEEQDQRISAWAEVADHPFFADCFESDEPEKAVAKRLDQLSAPEPKEIKFEDIRKGDLIRVEDSDADFTRSRTGIAVGYSNDRWFTAGGYLIVGSESEGTLYLLSRPMPPLPTEPGTIFRATKIRGIECDVTVLVTGDPYGANLYATSQPIKFALLHEAHHINQWHTIGDPNA